MSASQYILFAQETAGTVVAASVRGREVQSVETTVEHAGQTLRSLGYQGGGVLLALPSTWCLAAAVDLSGLKQRDRKAVLFRLEEHIPLAAEEVTAAVAVGSTSRSALGVCVQTSRVRELLNSLESAGVNVELIVPAALLAAQALAKDGIAILVQGARADVIAIEQGSPKNWSWGASEDVGLQFRILSRGFVSLPQVFAVGDDLAMPGTEINRSDRSILQLSCEAGSAMLESRTRPWINLRTDTLAPGDTMAKHRRAMNLVLVAAACLLLSVATVFWVRAARYNAAARQAEVAMTDAFHTKFPDWPIPGNVRAVVQSELAKLSIDSRGSDSQSALATLRRGIGALPGDVAISVDAMTFDPGAFEMSGKVTDAAAVESLANGLRAAGFEGIQATQSRRIDSAGLGFIVSGAAAKK